MPIECTKYYLPYQKKRSGGNRPQYHTFIKLTLHMKATKKQSRKRSLNVIIPLVVYPFDVMVSFGQTDEQLKRQLIRFGVEWDQIFEMGETTMGRTTLTPGNTTVLRLQKIPESCLEYGFLAHEIFHAVTFLLERIGMTLTSTSDEAYAYLIGYLTTEIYKHL